MQLVDHHIEVAICTEAKGINPRQRWISDQNPVLSVGTDDTNGVIGKVAEVQIAGNVDVNTIADGFIRPPLYANCQVLSGWLKAAQILGSDAVHAASVHGSIIHPVSIFVDGVITRLQGQFSDGFEGPRGALRTHF